MMQHTLASRRWIRFGAGDLRERNRRLSYLSMRNGVTRSLGFPSSYIIEATNACDQKCTICETGLGLITRGHGHMDFDNYCRLVDQIAPYARNAGLYWMGESFLHPRIYEMIAYFKAKRPSTHLLIAANGNFLDPVRVVQSGLDEIEFKLGGLDQETHATYRVGGKLSVELANILAILEARKNLGICTPRVGLGFIVMKHNEHQLKDFPAYAEELGVDYYNVTKPTVRTVEQGRQLFPECRELWSYDPEAFDRGELIAKGVPRQGETCETVWDTLAVNWDGVVTPCCWFMNGENPYGNVFDLGLLGVWNSPRARAFRRRMMRDEKTWKCRHYCHSNHAFTPALNTTAILLKGTPGQEGNPFHAAIQHAMGDGWLSVMVAGAGSGAVTVARHAREVGLAIHCFTDRDPLRQGTRLARIPVVALAEGLSSGLPVIIGTVAFAEEVSRDVRRTAQELGLPEPAMYFPLTSLGALPVVQARPGLGLEGA